MMNAFKTAAVAVSLLLTTTTTVSASVPSEMFLRMTEQHQLSYTAGMITVLKSSDYFSQCDVMKSPKTLTKRLAAYVKATPSVNGNPMFDTLKDFLVQSC